MQQSLILLFEMNRPVTDLNNNNLYRKRFRGGVNEQPVQSTYEQFDERNVSDWNNRNSFRDHPNGALSVTNREYPSQNRQQNVPEDYRSNYSRDK